MKKKFRVGLIVFATAIIIAELILIGNSNVNFYKNAGSYLVISGMIATIVSMIVSIIYDKKP